MADEFSRILLIKMSSLGDVTHGLPVACALRERFPNARLAWLVDERFRWIVDGHHAIDQVIAAPAPKLRLRPSLASFVRAAAQYGIAGDLRRGGFDLVVDLQGLFRTGVLALASGAPVRVGFREAREGAPLFYTRWVSAPRNEHAVARCLRLAASLGADVSRPCFNLNPPRSRVAAAAERLRAAGLGDGEPFVVVAPKSSHPAKDWPAARFGELIGLLWKTFRLRAAVVGGPADRETCAQVAALSHTPAVTLVGQSLAETLAIFKEACLFVGNDSGPLHLAAALGTPVVAIFGPTDPVKTGPFGQLDRVVRDISNCGPCQRGRRRIRIGSRYAGQHTCLSGLPASVVFENVARLLEGRSTRGAVA